MASNSSGDYRILFDLIMGRVQQGLDLTALPSSRSPLEPLSLMVRMPTRIIYYLDGVTRLHQASYQDPRKDPFPGHNAVSHLFADGAALMAGLADLGYFQFHFGTDS